MSLLLAPYNDSMRLGQGFNSYTHELCIDDAVKISVAGAKNTKTPSQVVSYSSRFIEKLSDVVDTLSISYGSSIKKGTVEISGNANTLDETTFKQSDLNAVVSVKVVNQTTIIDDDAEFQLLDGIVPGSARFNEVYGDSYISGFITGGDFTGIFSVKVLDQAQKDSVINGIKDKLSTAGKKDELTLDMFDSGTNSVNSSTLKGTESNISVSWMGGGQVKDAQTPWDINSLYAAAAAFPAKVADCPQRTWAILTKYKANRSFIKKTNKDLAKTLEYEQVIGYTAELFDNFMSYKMMLKTMETIIRDRNDYVKREDVGWQAIPPDMATLINVRSAMRDEQQKIVEAVDILSRDPGCLKKQYASFNRNRGALVEAIIAAATNRTRMLDTPPAAGATKPDAAIKDVKNPGSKKPDAPSTSASSTKPSVAATSDFDFGSIVPAEVWEDLLPIQATPIYTPTGFQAQGFSSWPPPPPPSDDHVDASKAVPSAAAGFFGGMDAQQETKKTELEDAKREATLSREAADKSQALAEEAQKQAAAATERAETAEREASDANAKALTAQKLSGDAAAQVADAERESAQFSQQLSQMTSDNTASTARAEDAEEERDKLKEKVAQLESELGTEQQAKQDMTSARDQAMNAIWQITGERDNALKRCPPLRNKSQWDRSGVNLWLIMWGGEFIWDDNIANKLVDLALGKAWFRAGNDVFNGNDPMPGTRKVMTVIYRYNDEGPYRCLLTREGDNGRFDV
ncbi:hypothetical protein MMC18_007062 [Xylographa bjoerkii]|nr:hypothetical protein [Xylographa bjoerkii]